MEVRNVNNTLYFRSLSNSMREKYTSNPIQEQNTKKDFKFTSYNFYMPIAFSGGKSMNLAETKNQLDKYNAYPSEGLKEEIDQTLQNGNPDKKLLLDVHKDYYSDLKYCNDVSDAAYMYSEFKGVLSDSQVSYNKGSFIDKVKHGEIKGFDPDEDVSVQLIQLYWGEGFSLNALQKEYGQNITGVFDKLRIPTVNKVYGLYLKLSDKDYNEQFSNFMSQRAKEIEHKKSEHKIENREEINQQEKCGSAISTSRGPLSDEHRHAIGEGIKQHYIEHPEELAQMSEKRKKYFEEHPEESERFSQVLLRAWNYKEAEPIKRRLSKFMQKDYMNDNQALVNDMQNNTKLKAFWDKHKWAKDKFSICMTKSWARQNELTQMGLIYEPLYIANPIPSSLQKELTKLFDYDNFGTGAKYIFKDPREKDKSFDSMDQKPIIIATMIYGVFSDGADKNKLLKLLEKWEISMLLATQGAIEQFNKSGYDMSAYKQIYEDHLFKKDESTVLPFDFYSKLINQTENSGNVDFIKSVDKNMSRIFDKIINKSDEDALKVIDNELNKLQNRYGVYRIQSPFSNIL